MVDFGENLCTYKPPINTKTIAPIINDLIVGKAQHF
jgi:nitrate reductase alpha subunit